MRTLRKELNSTIKLNVSRFISIIAIIFLGVGFFVGMTTNAPILKKAMSDYLEETNFWDIKVFSLTGLTANDILEIKEKVPEIDVMEGKYYLEVLSNIRSKDSKAEDYPIFVHSYSKDYKINQIKVVEGNEIQNADECLVDKQIEDLGLKIGDYITLSDKNLKRSKYKIVGYAEDPQYISYDKGSSTILGTMVKYTAYIEDTNFVTEDDLFYTFDIKLKGNYKEFSSEYKKYVQDVKQKIEEESDILLSDRMEKLIEKKTQELKDAEKQYDEMKAKAASEIQTYQANLDSAERQINTAKLKLLPESKINAYLNSLKADLDASKNSLDVAEKSLKITTEVIDIVDIVINSGNHYPDLVCTWNNDGEEESLVTDGLSDEEINECYNRKSQIQALEPLKERFYAVEEILTVAREQLAMYYEYYNSLQCDDIGMPELTAICTDARSFLGEKIKAQEENINRLDESLNNLHEMVESVETYDDLVNIGKDYLVKAKKLYNDSLALYNDSVTEFDKASKQLKDTTANARNQIMASEVELASAKSKFEQKKKEASNELENFYNKIIEGKQLLGSVRKHSWIVNSRNDSYGYSSYYDDIIRLNNIAHIIPMIFFIAAALITATAIMRLIQEEKQKIGILKSLGCSRRQVILKYMKYSFFAAFFGTVFGILAGVYGFPILTTFVYGLRYRIPEYENLFYYKAIIYACIIALIATVGIAFISSIRVANEKPAKLLKRRQINKARKKRKVRPNKRDSIFADISNLHKLSFRNVFTSPIRNIMTIVGVMGCTGLIIASFGVRESSKVYADMQFDKVYTIDAELYYKKGLTQYDITQDYENLRSVEDVKNAALGRKETLYIKNGQTIEVYGVTPQSIDKFEMNMHLYSVVNKKKITLRNQTGVIITEKLAKLINKKIGDEITFVDSSNVEHTAKINDICENYLYNYIFMNKKTYNDIYGYEMQNNFVSLKYKDGVDTNTLVSNLINNNNYSSVAAVSYYKQVHKDIVDLLSNVILVIIISALLLAFVVLYNISKISIGEKTVEIANLKILGYDNKKIGQYIKNEIRILKYIGILLGLGLGYYLTDVVLTACEIDVMMFYHGISIISYIYGIAITIVFSLIINIIIHKDLKKVNLSQAFKFQDQ